MHLCRGVGISLADDTPEPSVTALSRPEIRLPTPADGVPGFDDTNIIITIHETAVLDKFDLRNILHELQ